MTDQVLATTYSKVLASPSDASTFTELRYLRGTEPTEAGVIDLGVGSGTVGAAFKFMPFAFGPPGSQFWVSLTGWSPLGSNQAEMVWIGISLGTFWCFTDVVTGPIKRPGIEPDRLVSELDSFCSIIMQTSGPPASRYSLDYPVVTPGLVFVPTLGSQKIKFDFALGDCVPGVGMNALWARA
jgi:hypothetical protein